MAPSKRRKPWNRSEAALRDVALSYPEAHEDFPWGHRAVKVRGKAFVFMSKDEPGLSLSVKLPASAEGALQFPFCEPTHYGLGRSGWVTATFGPKDRPPIEVLCSWIDESYRAVAPKRLVAALDGRSGGAKPARAGGNRPRAARPPAPERVAPRLAGEPPRRACAPRTRRSPGASRPRGSSKALPARS